MKNLIIAVFICMLFIECNTSEYSANDLTRRMLINKNWELSIVTVDGITRNIYSGLVLNFRSSEYTSLNGLKIFPASGTWKFLGDDGKRILRDDGLEITIESISEGQLEISFYWQNSTFIGGRGSELAGLNKLIFRRRL